MRSELLARALIPTVGRVHSKPGVATPGYLPRNPSRAKNGSRTRRPLFSTSILGGIRGGPLAKVLGDVLHLGEPDAVVLSNVLDDPLHHLHAVVTADDLGVHRQDVAA